MTIVITKGDNPGNYIYVDVSLLVKLDGLFYGVGVGILIKVMRGRMKSEAWVV
jgi:hypothetical protein